MIDKLNQRYALANLLEWKSGHGKMPKAVINSELCRGEIYLHGAHVTSWQPTDQQEDVLWVSKSSLFAEDRPIRGGIPVCWPWFGDDKTGAGRPAHGFARTCEFSVTRTAKTDDGGCEIELALEPSEATRRMWPEEFHLSLTATFGKTLDLQLRMENRSEKTVTHSSALHTYLHVSQAHVITLSGFKGHDYLDKVRGFERDHQQQEPKVDGEIDRIYLDTTTPCTVSDQGFDRTIQVAKAGSETTVLWNPGAVRSKQMADLDDEGYKNMLCIESANAADNTIALAPGEHHILGTTLRVDGS